MYNIYIIFIIVSYYNHFKINSYCIKNETQKALFNRKFIKFIKYFI